jgi:hypothetical protein
VLWASGQTRELPCGGELIHQYRSLESTYRVLRWTENYRQLLG